MIIFRNLINGFVNIYPIDTYLETLNNLKIKINYINEIYLI